MTIALLLYAAAGFLVGIIFGMFLGSHIDAKEQYEQGFADGEAWGIRYCDGPTCVTFSEDEQEGMYHECHEMQSGTPFAKN